MAADLTRTIDALWRIESPRLIAGLARMVRDVGLAEELAQDALVVALERWPETGVPDNPGAWLMATAKNRAIDRLRRKKMAERKHAEIGREMEEGLDPTAHIEAALDDDIGDDLLRLVFTACHPVLTTEARVALTLRLIGGLTTDEIARAFLVPEPTMAQRIVRAKRTLADANVGFEAPRGEELAPRLASVLEVIYLIFNEGYTATAGEHWTRPQLCEDALQARPHPGRAGAERAGGAWADGADGDPGLAARRPLGPGRRADPAHGPEPHALGPCRHPPRAGGARQGRGAGAARALHAAGGDRRLPRPRGNGRGHRLGAHRRALSGARRDPALAGGRTQPGGGGGHGGGA